MGDPGTLGRLKEYLSDISHSMADDTASRVHIRVIQDALRRLDRAHFWDHFRTRERITLDNAVSGSGTVSVVQGDRRFTLSAGVWLQRYVDEAWDLVLDDDTASAFRLVELQAAGKEALSEPGQRWVEDTVGGGDYTLYRTRYALEHRFKRVYRVALLREDLELETLNIRDFEDYRRIYLTSAGSQPWKWTTRGQLLEFWPPPSTGTEYQVEVDYQRHVGVPEESSDDQDLLDWPQELEDLLRAACKLGMLGELGEKRCAFDPSEAKRNYRELIAGYKGTTQTKRQQVYQMRLGGGSGGRPADPFYGHIVGGSITP